MFVPLASVIATLYLLLAGVQVLAEPLAVRTDKDGEGLKPICKGLKTKDQGCIRYVRGFDVTGVLTEVSFNFPEVKDECDCIQKCLDRPTTCANYVWKFSTPESVQLGHRVCTLYSNFNLPSDVTVVFDLDDRQNKNIIPQMIIEEHNNPQIGQLVPQSFEDVNLNKIPDEEAVSGPVWQLANGDVLC